MATDWRSWRAGGGTARQASTVAPWQQYLDGFGSGRRGGGNGLEPGSPEDVLSRAETSYANRIAEAQALGMDDTGEAAPGLLTRTVRGLDWLRAAAFNAGREGVDAVTGGDASLQDFRENLDRREGFGDLEALQMDDDDAWYERGAKGAAAFLGDVATDPLTYVTFGGAAVGKRAASEIVEAGVRQQAKGLSDDVLERYAKRSAPERSVEMVRRELGDEAADELAETALARPRTMADGTDEGWRRALGQDQLAGEAAAAYAQGGSTGLRRYLQAELGDEAGERAFRTLPRDVQGGLNIRVPLARRTLEDGSRTTLAAGIGGGGRYVGDAAMAGTAARNRVAATSLAQKALTHLGGQDGALYGAVIRDLVEGRGEQVGGHTYAMYAAVRRARRDAGLTAQSLHQQTAETVASMDRLVRESADPEAAARVQREMFQDPRRLAAFRNAAAVSVGGAISPSGMADDAGRQLIEQLPEAERAGVGAALLGHQFLEQVHSQLRGYGVSVGQITEYVPLILTNESRLSRQVRRPVRASIGQRGGVGGYNQTKEARQFWMPELADDGTITSWRRMAPDEVNRRQAVREEAGDAINPGDVYEADPMRMVVEYGEAARKLATRVRFANLLHESGALVRGGTEGVSRVVGARLRDAQGLLAESDSAWRRALTEAPGGSQDDAQPSAAAAGVQQQPGMDTSGSLEDQIRRADAGVLERAGVEAADDVPVPAGAAGDVPAATAPAAGATRAAFDEVFADIPASARAQVWERLFAGNRVVVPAGGMEARVREVLRRARWRPDGNEGGRAVFVAPAEQLRTRGGTVDATRAAFDALPAVPEGHTRLYRGETPEDVFERGTAHLTPEQREALFPQEQRGRWFTDDRDYAANLARGQADRIRYVDVPDDRVGEFAQQGFSPNAQTVNEFMLSDDDVLAQARSVDPLTARIDSVLAERATLDQAVARLVELPPAQQLEQVDALMDGIVDFVARSHEGVTALDDGSKAWKARVTEAEKRLTEARRARRDAVQTGSRLNDGATTLARQDGLRQIGLQDFAVRGIDNVNLPPEMDVTFAPEILARTAERYYKASRTESAELAQFIDAVYRPYLSFFKATATVGRGYGYDFRNMLGGTWNNWIGGVTADDHRVSMKLTRAVEKVDRQLRKTDLGPAEHDAEMAARLEPLLSKTKVAPGVTLWDVHIGMADNQVSMFNRLQEGLSDAVEGGTVGDWTRGDATVNLFRHRRPDELNRFQRGVNHGMSQGPSGRWLRHKGRLAENSERYLRGAAYIHGLREYGAADGGEMAARLTKGLHFDYDDLSDFERVWMRGFALPFYTWTRNNVPLQARALMHKPGLFNAANNFHEATENVLGADEEGGIVPEWMQERMGFVSRFSYGDAPIAIGMENSAVDLNRWVKVGRPGEMAEGASRELLNSLSPVIKAPLETLLGYNTFTGAAHSDRGAAAPGWYRALGVDRVPGMGWTSEDGQRRAPQALVDAAQNILPPLGLLERHVSGPVAHAVSGGTTGQASAERLGTTLLSNWLAAPVSTLTPAQQAGELRSRVGRINRRLDRSDVDPLVRQQAEELLERGYPPEIVEALIDTAA